MYPNPQEALPLPPRPHLEQYRKLSKELAKACRSDDPSAVEAWAVRWIDRLARGRHFPKTLESAEHIRSSAERLAQFARTEFARARSGRGTLATAQFVMARAHGFLSWPKFATHVVSLSEPASPIAAFERAVSAVVAGDAAALARLLRKHPRLARARSTREHGATLLHYVSANGVEGYHQLSPANSAEIARLLLDAGADVDAVADVYEGGCTPLGLVATSSPPSIAGVQRDVIDVLLAHGARMDRRGVAGRDGTLVGGCLANGQPGAAAYLAERGAPVDFVEAAGLGRVDLMRPLIDRASQTHLLDAYSLASAYGRVAVVERLLDRGVDVDAELRGWGEGHTALHVAAYQAHLDLVTLLLTRGARVDAVDKTWRTTPLAWALTGWSRRPSPSHYGTVAQLVAAGATVSPDVWEWDKVRADERMRSALGSS